MVLLAETKATPPLVWDAELERASLTNLFFGRYGGMLRAVHGVLTKFSNRHIPPPDNVAIRHMLLEARARAVQVDTTTQFAISAILAEGTRRGLSVREIAYGTSDFPGIEGLFERTWRSRPETVARTELQHAMLAANVDRFRAMGGVTGLLARDGDYDVPCANRNGQRFPLDKPPQMNHPNCLVGGQLVLAPNGQGGSARMFHGEVVVFRTAHDEQLTVTPNHPILTPRGWLAAGQLREGDRVVRCVDAQRVVRVMDPHNENAPALIEDVARSFGPAGHSTPTTVPLSSVDFHGDSTDGDVCVVWPDSRTESRARYVLGQFDIEWTYAQPASLAGSSASDQSLRTVTVAAPALVSSRGELQTLGWREMGEAQPHGLTRAAGRSELSNPTADGSLGDSQLLRDLAAAQLLDDVEIVDVRRFLLSDHVYNVQTEQGWYIAQNIITHNCRLTITPIFAENQ